MWELFALAVYSVQWLGIVLGVGAEVVLMVAHLTALHEHKPQWLATIPAVRAVQRWGLVLIVVSGVVAVGLQALLDPSVFLIPVFGFKWALIVLAWSAFLASRSGGRATIEGFAGGTWLALFVVHSVAPSTATWAVLGAGYAVWLAVFGLLWTSTVYLMGRSTARVAVPAPAAQPVAITPTKPAAAPRPVVIPPHKPAVAPQPVAIIQPKPVAPAQPAPVRVVAPPVVAAAAPKPVVPPVVGTPPAKPVVAPVILHSEPKPVSAPSPAVIHVAPPRLSLWKRFMSLFTRAPKTAVAPTPVSKPIVATPPPAPKPSMAAVSAPVHYNPPTDAPKPIAAKPVTAALGTPPAPITSEKPHPNLPVVEHLELLPPTPEAVVASAPSEVGYVPDWNDLPGLRIMPQKPEDLSKQNRAPLVQAA